MNYKFLILFTITISLFLIVDSITEALAKISYPSNNFRLDDQPTYCIVTPNIPNSQAEDLEDMAKIGVLAWKNKLRAAELNNKLLWDMRYKLVDSGFTNGCDITIYFKPTIEQIHDPGITTIGLFSHYAKSIEIAFKNVSAGKIYNIMIHEIGHSLGLGHFVSDDNEINLKWWTGDGISPSIMIPITHRDPSLMKITDVDVLKVRAIYGSKGFSAFSTEPLPVPIPTPTPTPIPTPKPIQPIIPVFPFESIAITHEIIEVGKYEEQQFVKIIGDIKEGIFRQGIPVYLVVKSPAESFQTLKILTTKDAHFETTLVFDGDSARGTYKVEASYLEHHDREMDFTFRVVEKSTVTTPLIPKFDEAPTVSGIGKFDVSFSDNEYTFSGYLGGYDQSVRLTAENECPTKKQVHNQDYLVTSNRNTEASFTFRQLSYGKPEQCTINLTLSDFYGKLLEQTSFNYKIQTQEKSETTQILENHPFASTINQELVPSWIKNNAKWWSEGTIDDNDFTSGIQFMIKENIISIPDLPEVAQMELKDEKRAMGLERDKNVPDWVRNNAGWWADGLISEDDFLNGIKYLIEQGIIRV